MLSHTPTDFEMPFSNNGLERRNWQEDRGRVAPKTKIPTGRAPPHDDSSANDVVVVVELSRSRLAPVPTSRNSTAGPVEAAITAETMTGTCDTMSPSVSLSLVALLRPWGAAAADGEFPSPPALPLSNPLNYHALSGSGDPTHHVPMADRPLPASVVVGRPPTLSLPHIAPEASQRSLQPLLK